MSVGFLKVLKVSRKTLSGSSFHIKPAQTRMEMENNDTGISNVNNYICG